MKKPEFPNRGVKTIYSLGVLTALCITIKAMKEAGTLSRLNSIAHYSASFHNFVAFLYDDDTDKMMQEFTLTLNSPTYLSLRPSFHKMTEIHNELCPDFQIASKGIDGITFN